MIVERTDAAIDALVADLGRRRRVVDLYPVGRASCSASSCARCSASALAARADEIGDLFQRPQDYLESSAVRQLPHPFPCTRGRGCGPTGQRSTPSSTARSPTRRRTPTG